MSKKYKTKNSATHEVEVTSLEQSILNARSEYVCGITVVKLENLAKNHNVPIDILRDCYKQENWAMQRNAYLVSASNELNIQTQAKKAEENFKSLDLMSILREKSVQQILKRIDDD
jgi:hypothetical protein